MTPKKRPLLLPVLTWWWSVPVGRSRHGRGAERLFRQSGDVELLIDEHAIMSQLAGRALLSKARRSRALHGAVEVRVARGTEKETAL